MVISMFINHIKELHKDIFLKIYLVGIIGIFTALSISGFTQAGFNSIPTHTLWIFRTLFGVVTFTFIFAFIKLQTSYSKLGFYNLIGVLSDGLGGVFLILLASFLYPILGFSFNGVYEYVVFTFVSMTGIIHYLALKNESYQYILTKLSVIIRVFASSMFFALYSSGKLGIEALAICLFDLTFVFIYLIFIQKKEFLCKD